MIIINQLYLGIEEPLSNLRGQIATRLRLKEEGISYTILKESLDARRRDTPRFSYQVAVDVPMSEKQVQQLKDKNITWQASATPQILVPGECPLESAPLIVGAGPAGLFAAYTLAKHGYRPMLLEQGEAVPKRSEQVEQFWQDGTLDVLSNVQFGEGGAGTFSDGKLTSRSKNPLGKRVLQIFANHGAPKEITYQAKPHIGTDLLKGVIVSMREQLIAWGGSVQFGVQVQDLLLDGNRVKGVVTNQGTFYSDVVILALGHSSRPLFRKLHEQGLAMESKPFAMGFRIEHPQTMINERQHRQLAGHPRLGAADYQLTWHDDVSGRGVYTFCMCPGGQVVAASSEKERLVVNGMSYHARDLENANSALLVNVSAKDYGDGVLDGMHFQEKIESACYGLGGGGYVAPVQTVGDFLIGAPSTTLGAVKPSVQPGYQLTDLSRLYPAELTTCLRAGIGGMGKKLAGFDRKDAILTGAETRSSSPVRLLRDKATWESVNISGVYPIGEGAGYAGGIVSSAIDGIACAEQLIRTYQKR